jgi:NAD(P)-dependent dehydrogenase (short-subunit alcohol dehydrogenase family)
MAAALPGSSVIVTGAGGGLGRAFALAFAAAGARVCAADIDAGAAADTAAAVSGAGGNAVAVASDVATHEGAAAIAAAAIEAFGAIDVLVNNAAVYAGLPRRGFEEIPIEEWDRVMAVNVRGPWLCARACAPAMRARGGGAIVNIASATFHTGSPLFAHYVASKGALIALTRVLARELGDDSIRVNAIAPGFTLTQASRDRVPDAETYGVDRGAIKRAVSPEDLVGTAVFLASEASAMMTGQTLIVDGGRQFI